MGLYGSGSVSGPFGSGRGGFGDANFIVATLPKDPFFEPEKNKRKTKRRGVFPFGLRDERIYPIALLEDVLVGLSGLTPPKSVKKKKSTKKRKGTKSKRKTTKSRETNNVFVF
jgi:hypothetical protein